jgi:hypothetical protein
VARLIFPVYFLYPETANVRLEDMNALFGDATTAMPTPAQAAEQDSLMGVGSPSSIDIRGGGPRGSFSAQDAIPGLDIDPPNLEIGPDGKPIETSRGRSANGEGLGGWIGRMVSRNRQDRSESQGQGRYAKVGQDED